jgi:hypothetical protein
MSIAIEAAELMERFQWLTTRVATRRTSSGGGSAGQSGRRTAWSVVVAVAAMVSRRRAYPTRVACPFQGKGGQVVLDQIRTVNKSRLVREVV